jgi:hypothetical protein
MAKMNEWLEQYEKGDLEADIARRSKSDLRTVRQGIEQARRHKEAAAARTQILIESFRQHQKDLTDVVDSLIHGLTAPGTDVAVPLNDDGFPEKLYVGGTKAVFQGGDTWKVVLNEEASPLYELLREHLKRDPIWKHVENWKMALAAHLQARVALKRRAGKVLLEGTKYKLVADNEVGSKRGFVYANTVDFFYQVMLERALGTKKRPDFEKRIRVTPAGYVEHGYGNPVLAYAPGRQEKTRKRILMAYKELTESPETENVGTTYYAVEKASTKAGAALQEVLLLRMVPGQCRVCRRLGM